MIQRRESFTHLVLYALFFLSGCSALIYQIMWERMLFTLFGVDLQSITIIVSVFMFGLGIGALMGGVIADKMSSRLLMIYVIIEAGIAECGWSSPGLIQWMGSLTVIDSKLLTAISSFILLAIPTILMGATFPILVTHVNSIYHHIGRTVGGLYFANTIGGALGAYFSGFVLLYVMDVVDAINCAVVLNLAIAGIAFILFRKKRI